MVGEALVAGGGVECSRTPEAGTGECWLLPAINSSLSCCGCLGWGAELLSPCVEEGERPSCARAVLLFCLSMLLLLCHAGVAGSTQPLPFVALLSCCSSASGALWSLFPAACTGVRLPCLVLMSMMACSASGGLFISAAKVV